MSRTVVLTLAILTVLGLAVWLGWDLAGSVLEPFNDPAPRKEGPPVLETRKAPDKEAAAADAPPPPAGRPTDPSGKRVPCLRIVRDDEKPAAGLLVVLEFDDDAQEGQTDEGGWLRLNGPVEQLSAVLVPNAAEDEDDDDEGVTLQAFGRFVPARGDPACVVLQLPSPGRITGQVLNLAGKPETDAEYEITPIRVLSVDPTMNLMVPANEIEGDVEEDGRFDVAVPLGHYKVRLTYVGSKLLATAQVELTPQCRSAHVDLHLAGRTGGRTVVVHIKGLPEGHSAPRVSLKTQAVLHEIPQQPRPGVLMRTEKSHVRQSRKIDESTYEFEHVEDVPWTLSVWARDFESVRGPVPAGATEVTAVMVPKAASPDGRWLRGTVQTETGPLDGATVSIEDPEDSWLGVGAFDFSGRDGTFAIALPDDTREREVFVRVKHDGKTRAVLGPMKTTDPIEPLTIRLAPARTLTARFVDADGRGVSCYHRIRLAKMLQIEPLEYGRSDDDGNFTYERLPPGPHEIRVYPRNAGIAPARVRVDDGQETVKLVAGDGYPDLVVATGTVRDAFTGRSLPDVDVAIETDAFEYDAQTGPFGAFKVRLDRPGRLWVWAGCRGYATLGEERTLTKGENRVDVALLPARMLHLRVVDASGRPLEGVRVLARQRGGAPVWEKTPGMNVSPVDPDGPTTDPGGRIDLLGLPAGPIELFAGYPPDMHYEDVFKNEPDRAVDLTRPLPDLVTIKARDRSR